MRVISACQVAEKIETWWVVVFVGGMSTASYCIYKCGTCTAAVTDDRWPLIEITISV